MKERIYNTLNTYNDYTKRLKAYYVRKMQRSIYSLHTCGLITASELEELDAIINGYILDMDIYSEMISEMCSEG